MIIKIEKVKLYQNECAQWCAQVECTKLPLITAVTYKIGLDNMLSLSTIGLATKIAKSIVDAEGADGKEIKVVESSWNSL